MGLLRHKRRATDITTVAALSMALLGGGTIARADDGTTQGRNASSGSTADIVQTLDFVNAEFKSAVQVLIRKTGIQLVLIPNTQGHPYENITVSLRDKPVSEVLHVIAAAGGADLWEQDGVYYLGPKGSGPRPIPVPTNDDTDRSSTPRPLRIEKIRLKYISPHQVLHFLGIEGALDAMDVLRQNSIRQMVEMSSINTKPYVVGNGLQVLPSTGTTQVGPAAPGGDPVSTVPSRGVNSGPTNAGNPSGAGVSGTGSGSDQGAQRDGNGGDEFGRGQGFPGGGGFGGGGFPGGGQGGFPGGGGAGAGFGQGGAGGAQQQANISGLLPPGVTPNDIYALDADNSIILTREAATAQNLAYLQDVIREIDIKPRQLLIRAQFVTVLQNDTSSFGINWNFTKVNLVAGANLGYQTSSTAFIQYAAGNLQTQLSWILTTGRGKVVASPTATTLNGVPVQLINQQVVPIFLSTPVIAQNGTVALAPNLVLQPVIIGLTITPRINGDDSIALTGSVVAQDILGTVVGPNGSSAPEIEGQTVEVQRFIRNGDTMVIGGLVRKNDNVQTNKVPLLGDLPLVGTLFRSHNITTQDSELLIFITPEIIPERNSNATAGALPGAGGAGAGGASGVLP